MGVAAPETIGTSRSLASSMASGAASGGERALRARVHRHVDLELVGQANHAEEGGVRLTRAQLGSDATASGVVSVSSMTRTPAR